MSTRLRFPDEATARAVLARYLRDGAWLVASHDHALDPAGVLHEIVDDTPVALDGWHVNLIGALPPGAEPYIINPDTPLRVWAGEDTP